MKTFYNDKEKYLPEANSFSGEIFRAINPIFKKWIAKGYRAREMREIIFDEINDIVLDHILKINGWKEEEEII